MLSATRRRQSLLCPLPCCSLCCAYRTATSSAHPRWREGTGGSQEIESSKEKQGQSQKAHLFPKNKSTLLCAVGAQRWPGEKKRFCAAGNTHTAAAVHDLCLFPLRKPVTGAGGGGVFVVCFSAVPPYGPTWGNSNNCAPKILLHIELLFQNETPVSAVYNLFVVFKLASIHPWLKWTGPAHHKD